MKWISYGVGIVFTFLSAVLHSQEAPVNIKNVVTIDIQQAKWLHDQGAMFIDVRSVDQWRWGRVEGAHNLDLRSGFRQLFTPGTLNKSLPIVIYGNSSYHMRGAIASYLAAMWGYKRVYFFREGYYSWLALDYPVTLKSDSKHEEVAKAQSSPSEALDSGI